MEVQSIINQCEIMGNCSHLNLTFLLFNDVVVCEDCGKKWSNSIIRNFFDEMTNEIGFKVNEKG